MFISDNPEVIPARQQAGLDRVLAFLSKHCDEIRVVWTGISPVVGARPKAMLDYFGEPVPPPHAAELDAPDMIVQGIARTVEVKTSGLEIETPGGLVIVVEWLKPLHAR